MAKVTYDDGTVINFEGKPSSADIEEAYNSVKGTKSPSQAQQSQPKQSIGSQLLQSTLNFPNKVIRGVAEPMVKAVGAAGLGINDIISKASGDKRIVPEYDFPFPGGAIPVRRMQNMAQATGLGLQGGSLAMGGSPAIAGAVYGGGQAMEAQKSGIDIAKQTAIGGALGYGAGVATGRYNIGANKEKLVKEATTIYRNILRPSKTEISKIEVGKGGNIDNYYKLAAKEGLPIKKSVDGKLDTLEATDMLQQKQEVIHSQLNVELAKNNSSVFNLKTIGEQAKKSLSGKIKNAYELKVAKANIDEYISAEIERNGNELVNATNANNIKQGMWSVSYNKFDPVQSAKADSARAIGHVIKNDIEKTFPNSTIQSLNKISGDYATLETLLKNAHARSIPKGFAGKIIGAIAGHSLKSFPVGGTVLGSKVGGAASNFINNPDIASKFAAWKMQRALK